MIAHYFTASLFCLFLYDRSVPLIFSSVLLLPAFSVPGWEQWQVCCSLKC